MSNNVKDTNPKDAVGIKKACMSTVSDVVMFEIGVAMLEGARKYGRHNWRVAGVRPSVYIDAAKRHLAQWWEGQDIDPDSGISHLTKAMASLMVLRDAMIRDKMIDDRPPKTDEKWMEDLNMKASKIIEKYPTPKEAYLEGDQHKVYTTETYPFRYVVLPIKEYNYAVDIKIKNALLKEKRKDEKDDYLCCQG